MYLALTVPLKAQRELTNPMGKIALLLLHLVYQRNGPARNCKYGVNSYSAYILFEDDMLLNLHFVSTPMQVKVIRSCRDGINKVVELLQQRFPNVSKSQLKSKVREVSDFVDNHWKVRVLSNS
jgi:hypothetical protein